MYQIKTSLANVTPVGDAQGGHVSVDPVGDDAVEGPEGAQLARGLRGRGGPLSSIKSKSCSEKFVSFQLFLSFFERLSSLESAITRNIIL